MNREVWHWGRYKHTFLEVWHIGTVLRWMLEPKSRNQANRLLSLCGDFVLQMDKAT
ncbi:hypothetical protein [Nostoc sp.]